MKGKRLIKNIAFTLIYQIIAIITGFIVPKAIIQNYGSSVNGLISSITQFLAYIYIAEGGVGVVVKYLLYKPIAQKDKSEIEKILKSAQRFFRHIFYIYIVYVLILCIVYPHIVSDSFDKYFTISLIIIIAISRFSEYFMSITYNLYLQANQKNYVIAIFNTITVIANTVITIILIKLNYSIETIKIANALIFIIRAMCYKIYIKKKYEIDLSKPIEKYEIKHKRDAFAHQIASTIGNNIDIVLITYFLGTAEVSVYTVYMLVFKGLSNIVSAILGGVDSNFGNMFAKKEYERANEKFTIYQFIYFFIITLMYNLCMLLLIPFIQVYTNGIIDANYYRPVFAIIITITEFICVIKRPYEVLINAIGHFKQMKKFAYMEAAINTILSIILIIKLKLIGVVIGTLAAMAFKLCIVVYYFSKKILKRSLKIDLKFLLLIAVQSIIIIAVGSIIVKNSNVTNYFSWFILAVKLGIVTVIIEAIINIIFNRKLITDIIKEKINIVK